MIICRSKAEIQSALREARGAGARIAAVPTMGALHGGHLSLIDTAKTLADRTVATIFVNPLQFGPNEDFDTYPRTIDEDLRMLEARGCDLVFAPPGNELIASDFSTTVSVAGVGEDHCANSRPQFFNGVATIVTKLLMILSPDVAVFGEKDYQQLAVIKRLVRDLDIDVEIHGSPTIREADGLALSSRNAYLTPQERTIAPLLFETMTAVAEKLRDREAVWPEIRVSATARLLEAGFAEIDYLNLVDAAALTHIERVDRPARLLAAAWLGKTRLIDNIPIAARPS